MVPAGTQESAPLPGQGETQHHSTLSGPEAAVSSGSWRVNQRCWQLTRPLTFMNLLALLSPLFRCVGY